MFWCACPLFCHDCAYQYVEETRPFGSPLTPDPNGPDATLPESFTAHVRIAARIWLKTNHPESLLTDAEIARRADAVARRAVALGVGIEQRPGPIGERLHTECRRILMSVERDSGESGPSEPRNDQESGWFGGGTQNLAGRLLEELPERDREVLSSILQDDDEASRRDEICRRWDVDDRYLRLLLFRARLRFRDLEAKDIHKLQGVPDDPESPTGRFRLNLGAEQDHQTAVSSQSVEHYLLNDLAGPLRTAFEDHYFGCPQCAEALRTGVMLRENVRTLLSHSQNPASAEGPAGIAREAIHGNRIAASEAAAGSRIGWMPRPTLRDLVPWTAAVLLLAVVIRQRADLTTPLADSATSVVLRSDSRGVSSSAATVPAGGLLSLLIDVPEDGAYRWNFRRRDRQAVLRSGAGQALGGSLAVVMDSRQMEPGTYVMALTRDSHTPLPDRLYYFELTRAQKN